MRPSEAYAAVPYEGGTYPQTHPDILATVSSLVGLRPAPPSRCRVLEIGCADGANLLGMASYLPGSEFVGIDVAPNQIATGEALREAAGLSNVSLLAADLRNPPDLGQFDYIIAHGLYSWIPAADRAALLALCRQWLAPQGVAYVSYNTLPGWHSQRVVRDLMRFHARSFYTPEEIVSQARAIVGFAAQATGSPLYKSYAAYLSVLPDDYLFHDHLETNNEPFYLHEFIDQACGHGLQYLGDAELHHSLDLNFPEPTRSMLHQLTDDPVVLEQYLDFLTDRTLRRTLLCHAEVPLSREVDRDWVAGLEVALPLTEVSEQADGATAYHRPGIPEDMVLAQTPGQRAILETLRTRWPCSLPLRDLPAEAPELLLACALRGFAELRTWSAPIVRHGGERPRVAPLVRVQAERGLPLTNALLQRIVLPADDLALVARLDGTYTPTEAEQVFVDRLGWMGLLIA